MARRKLSEYRAKTLLGAALGEPYAGISVEVGAPSWRNKLEKLPADGRYVIKVDQAIKRRYHLGLLKLDRSTGQLDADIEALAAQGFGFFLIEPVRPHQAESERYLALTRQREGVRISYAARGGVDVEHDPTAVASGLAESPIEVAEAARVLGVPADWLERMVAAFNQTYCSFLEINPLVVDAAGIAILDAAAEVDDAATLLVGGAWTRADWRSYSAQPLTKPEQTVAELASRSQASFSLEALNPDGAVFLLLSGGGASVVLADEVADLGYGRELANYGEYSGNPSTDETETYTAAVLELLLASKAPSKVLIIAGGVANFTDVRATFNGIIQALRRYEDRLREARVQVYVRRGGPHETEGLAIMRSYLEDAGLLGAVAGPELILTEIVGQALKGVQNG